MIDGASAACAGASGPRRKAHFVFLDGMRGIAALAVGWLHASQIFSIGYHPFHAFLAVDFFFCLSGFVVACAYDHKLAHGMTFGDFAIRRMIRLYPMILCGVLVGALVSSFEAGAAQNELLGVVALTASALVLVPLGFAFGQEAYPVNNPIWTLFFELAGSFVYGFERRFVRLRGLIPLLALVLTGTVLVFSAHHWHTLEVLGYSDPKMFVGGLVRLAFPFLAGVLIYRSSVYKLGFALPSPPLAAALFLILCAPISHVSWIYDSISVLILFPALIILGAGANCSGRLAAIWSLFGRLSYPFYLIHQPIIRAVRRLKELSNVPEAAGHALVPLSVLLAIGCAWAVTALYDEPVRRWLSSLRPQHRLAAPPDHSQPKWSPVRRREWSYFKDS
ncbi:MAG TPA: acyltransferase [Phenylobacterium sp.]|uniref:acyltransferase family protein n=1 Tax=Phenylobacterium sp. TaxID=1871053 RepID=UPI002B4603FE|nr:acyltransferase [Phenylobacterium sp.]HKR86621.1 acyltransferase [Phenylobacterium sp.]